MTKHLIGTLTALAVSLSLSGCSDSRNDIELKGIACDQELLNKANDGIEIYQYLVASCYFQGVNKEFPKNYKEAEKWYKKLGDIEFKQIPVGDQFVKLGVIYQWGGHGVKVEKLKSYQEYMKGAKMGNPDAQNNLDALCKESPWACK